MRMEIIASSETSLKLIKGRKLTNQFSRNNTDKLRGNWKNRLIGCHLTRTPTNLVQIFSNLSKKRKHEFIVTKLLSTVPITESKSGLFIFKAIQRMLSRHVSWRSGTRMVGSEKVVAKRLRDIYPYITTFNDPK